MKYRKILLFLLLAAGSMMFGATVSLAGDIKMIANSGVNVGIISLVDLKAVFLEEKSSINGTHVEPVLKKTGRCTKLSCRSTSAEEKTICRRTIVRWSSRAGDPCQRCLDRMPRSWLMWRGREVRLDM